MIGRRETRYGWQGVAPAVHARGMGARVGAEVGGTVRGSARHGGGQGAAARRHSEQQQLSTWCTGRGGEAAGDERAAGWRRRTLARDPSTRAACVHALRAAARAQVAKGSVCAECEMRRRRAAGRRRRTFGARPKHKGRLARGTWWSAVRTGSNEGQAHSCCPGSGSQSERGTSARSRARARILVGRGGRRDSNTWYPHVLKSCPSEQRISGNKKSHGDLYMISIQIKSSQVK